MDSTNGETTIEASEQTAERVMDLAWSFERVPADVAKQCLRYGLRNYEQALELDCDN